MFTVDKIPDLPVCKVVRFNIEYNILYFEEKMPENFTLGELDLFHQYFFYELLELWDWSVDGRFYFMPRFFKALLSTTLVMTSPGLYEISLKMERKFCR